MFPLNAPPRVVHNVYSDRQLDERSYLFISQETKTEDTQSETEQKTDEVIKQIRDPSLGATLDEVKAQFQDGVDYRVVCQNRKSWITIVSPHGGFIEGGTTELGAAIAGGDYNFFGFSALNMQNAEKLHVTSTLFSDNKLTEMLFSSKAAVSIHGRRDRDDPESVWLGGLNTTLKDLIGSELKKAGFKVDLKPKELQGTSEANFVNLPDQHGVQLEIPYTLRKRLVPKFNAGEPGRSQPPALPVPLSESGKQFVNAVRKAIAEYKH